MKWTPFGQVPPVAGGRPQCSVGGRPSPAARAAGALVLLGLGLAPAPACVATEALPSCTLEVQGAADTVRSFTVEIAGTDAARHQGLMGRTMLPARHGMLFVFERPNRIAMWMKDTPLPLDMLFFDGGGRLVHLERGAEPDSLRHRQAAVPVRYVLEVNGGEAAEFTPEPAQGLVPAALARCVEALLPQVREQPAARP